jgi:hypothetical protein
MAAASCAGLLLLGVAWLSMVGEAENLSADPGNAGGVALLWSIVRGEVAVLLAGVSLLLPARTRRLAGQLLPFTVWFLVSLDFLFYAGAGFY